MWPNGGGGGVGVMMRIVCGLLGCESRVDGMLVRSMDSEMEM